METSFEDVVNAVRTGLGAQFEITDEQDWTDKIGGDRDYVYEFNSHLLPKNKRQREPRCRATLFTTPDGVEVEVAAAFYDPDFVDSRLLLQLCQKHHDHIEAEFSIVHEYVEHQEKFTVEMRMFHFVPAAFGENFDPKTCEAFAALLQDAAGHLFKK